MLILSLILIVSAWITVIILCWKFVLPAFIKPETGMAWNAAVSLLLGGFLSPGLAVGHGAMILPAGVAAVLHVLAAIDQPDTGQWTLATGNLVSWLIMSTVFFFRDP